jgi:hypothetical protein
MDALRASPDNPVGGVVCVGARGWGRGGLSCYTRSRPFLLHPGRRSRGILSVRAFCSRAGHVLVFFFFLRDGLGVYCSQRSEPAPLARARSLVLVVCWSGFALPCTRVHYPVKFRQSTLIRLSCHPRLSLSLPMPLAARTVPAALASLAAIADSRTPCHVIARDRQDGRVCQLYHQRRESHPKAAYRPTWADSLVAPFVVSLSPGVSRRALLAGAPYPHHLSSCVLHCVSVCHALSLPHFRVVVRILPYTTRYNGRSMPY